MKLVRIDRGKPAEGWNEIADACPDLNPWGRKCLEGGLGTDVGYVLIESGYLCKDHRNLHSHFFSKKFNSKPPWCQRLHFFAGEPAGLGSFISKSKIQELKLKEQYIGYSVVRPITGGCLGRTVIDGAKLSRLNNNKTFFLRTHFKSHIYGHRYIIEGYPYTSQDSDATVCAHSALWGLCRYLSEKHTAYRELYPYDLIAMTGKSNGRSVPYRGMTYTDYSEILAQFGTHPVIIKLKEGLKDPTAKLKWEKYRDVCTYVESGFPVLASLSGHVVTLIGHTIDYSLTPDAHKDSFTDAGDYVKEVNAEQDKSRFIDSAVFWKEFVVVDDNFFPYQLFGYSGDPNNYGKKYEKDGKEYSIESILAAVCPLPEKAFMPADDATRKAREALKVLLEKHNVDKLEGPYVTRIFLTSSSSFKRRKLESTQGKADIVASVLADLPLPHFIWVMELYLLSEYSKGSCCGEVMLDATAGKRDEGTLYLRLAKKVYLYSDEEKKELDADTDRFRQYTHNLGERD